MAKKMIKKTRYKMKSGSTTLELDLSRFERQYEKAQFDLDNLVMTSMVPYMPMVDGVFIDVTRAMSESLAGTGTVVAAAPPFGRFLYEGVKMVDEETGRGPFNIAKKDETPEFRYRKGAKLKATKDPLNYDKNRHPDVTDHWFDKAKKDHLDEWLKTTKKIAGGGKRKV